jgi:hypothetical protein
MFKKFISFIYSIPKILLLILFGVALLLIAIGVYRAGSAIDNLLTENKKLKQALTNLTDTGKIGYAKVTSQTVDSKGSVLSTELKFVETARDNELDKILEKNYTIDGDIVHFDALIVKFGDKVVMNGQKKSLYLWRRIYGENMPPGSGFPIEEPGEYLVVGQRPSKASQIRRRGDFWQRYLRQIEKGPFIYLPYKFDRPGLSRSRPRVMIY